MTGIRKGGFDAGLQAGVSVHARDNRRDTPGAEGFCSAYQEWQQGVIFLVALVALAVTLGNGTLLYASPLS